MSPLRIKHTTTWRLCSCDLRLLSEAQFGLNVACHLREKTHFPHLNEKRCNAPVCGYVKPRSPYRLYSDACNFSLAAILQQVQIIQLKDLKPTNIAKRRLKQMNLYLP